MMRPSQVYISQDRIEIRRGLFALQLLDAVTLEPISGGIDVRALGLHGKPVVNSSSMFVWLYEDIAPLQKILIDPRNLPYEIVELKGDDVKTELAAQVKKRPLPVELPPRVDYAFAAGITGLRGALVENRAFNEPVRGAQVQLRWLDRSGNWNDAPTRSHTTAKSVSQNGGDFVAILRFAPSDDPELDGQGNLTVRLRVTIEGNERSTADLSLPQGRVTSATIPNQSVFAWDELAP